MGLIGMEERVKKLGGTLKISSKSSQMPKGTILEIELPVSADCLP
jgi:signal transduction histidine kinase